MITEIADTVSAFFYKQNIVEKDKISACRYGMEIIISTIIGFGIIIGVGSVFNRTLVAFVYLLGIVPLRMYTGGYHANTYLLCNFVFAVIFVINLLLYETICGFKNEVLLLICTLWTFIPVMMYVPIENKNKKLSKMQRKKCKKISLVLYTVYYLTSLILLQNNNDYGVMILFVLNTVSILIMEVKISEKNKSKNIKRYC